MSELPISYSSEEKYGWCVWSIKGQLDRRTSAEATEAGEDILSNCSKLAVNLSELEYLSSAGIRVLLRLAKSAEAKGCVFAIVSPSGLVKEVLEMSRLDMLVSIYKNVDALQEE